MNSTASRAARTQARPFRAEWLTRQLNETGTTSHDILDGLFWIVDEDDQGFVGATPFSTEREYRAALDELEERCEKFYAS